MTTLHIVSQPGALASCMETAGEQDQILLTGEAAQLACEDHGRVLFVLEEDLASGISLSAAVQAVDYPGFVDLVVRNRPVVSWR